MNEDKISRFDFNHVLQPKRVNENNRLITYLPLTLNIFKDPQTYQLIAMLCQHPSHIAAMQVAAHDNNQVAEHLRMGLPRFSWFPLVWVNNFDEAIPALKKVLADAELLTTTLKYNSPFDVWVSAINCIYDDFDSESEDRTRKYLNCNRAIGDFIQKTNLTVAKSY